VFGIYPFNRYRRVELSGGVLQYRQSFNDPSLQQYSEGYQQQQFGRQLFQNGTFMPLTATFVEETTIFREFGPLSGRTMRLSYETAPAIGSSPLASDDRRGYPALHASRHNRSAGAATARFQELGPGAGLHLLRRQLRAARL
jgi:hypothetical protein